MARNRWLPRMAVLASVVLAVAVGSAVPADAKTGDYYYRNVGSGWCLNEDSVSSGPFVMSDGTQCKDSTKWKFNNAVHNGIWSFQMDDGSSPTYCLIATKGTTIVGSKRCNAATDTTQQWTVTYNSDGSATIKNVSTGTCMGVIKSTHVLDANGCTTSSYQHWQSVNT